jgi:nucleotide-binding universal stress UspA family protein
MGEPEVVLYDPTAEPRVIEVRLAERLRSLEGKRIAILDNSKANAGTLMLAVVDRLKERYGVRDVIKREKPVAGPPAPEIVEALSECDFVLVGSAD